MADKENFYSPDSGSQPEATPRKKPGPKPRSELHAVAAQVEETSTDLTADAGFSPELTEGEAGCPADAPNTLAADIARIRAQRKPFGAFTQKLAYPAKSGYHRHWFSDEPGRVDEAKSSGWAHVKDEKDQPVKRVVGRARDGGPLMGYLMEIPKVFWEEDMQSRHDAAKARVDEIKKSPFRAKPGQAQASDTDKFYSPSGDPLRISGPGGN